MHLVFQGEPPAENRLDAEGFEHACVINGLHLLGGGEAGDTDAVAVPDTELLKCVVFLAEREVVEGEALSLDVEAGRGLPNAYRACAARDTEEASARRR